jgi:hypothetical protein
VHQFQPTFKEASLLDDPELLPAVAAINQQILKLAPVLNSPTLHDAVTIITSNPDAPIAAMCKQQDESLYVFTVNTRNRPTKATIELRKSASNAGAQVLGEDRRIAIRDGRLEDAFKAYAVHLYQIEDHK